MSDTYRLGDPDFDAMRADFYERCRYHFADRPEIVPPVVQDDIAATRARFYDMVERHLRNLPATPSTPAKKQKKAKAPAVVEQKVIDGRPVEIEKYGDGTKDTKRDNAADALNWLIVKGCLNSRLDGPRSDAALERAWSDGNARRNTADELVDLFEKAELTPLRSPDLGGTPGGSFGPRFVGISKVTAMMMVQDLRRDMPPALMTLLDRILLGNEHVWHGKEKKQQARIFQDVRLALDFAAWALARQDGVGAQEKAKQVLCQKWELAGEWFRTRSLRLAVHQARVIKRGIPSRSKQTRRAR